MLRACAALRHLAHGLALLGAALAALGNAGCESCGFSFGPHRIAAHVVADVAPRDLEVQLCYDRGGDETCGPMYGGSDGAGGHGGGQGGSGGAAPEERTFSGEVDPQGSFGCYIPRFRVTAQAENCPKVEKRFDERDADKKEIQATTEVTLALACTP